MSTLKADTIQNTTGGAVTLTKQSAAKAWCYYDSTGTPSVLGSYNVSSLTDVTTGSITTNISSAMSSSTDLCMQGISNNFQTHNSGSPTTTTFNLYTSNSSGTAGDGGRNYLLVHGDLA